MQSLFFENLETLYQSKIELEVLKENLLDAIGSYNQLYNKSPVSFFTLNESGLIIDVNVHGAQLLGIEKELLINRHFSRYIISENEMHFLLQIKQAFETEHWEPCCLKLFRKDIPLKFIKVDGAILKNKDNKKLLLTITERNITHLKSENTETIIEKDYLCYDFVNMLANELNNPLGIISNYVYGALRNLERQNFQITNAHKIFMFISSQLERINEIILRMKKFIYKKELSKEYISIDTLVEETIPFIKAEFNHLSFVIKYRRFGQLPKIHVDKICIQQTLLHLSRNAIEAMQDSPIEEPRLIIESSHVTNNMVEITVVDNGPGYQTATEHKLFDAHFSTKKYGYGLGLLFSKKIIEAHGGRLMATLNPTYGACFQINLPIQY